MAGEKILVVDDEEMIRDLCYHILSAEGYQVTTAPNGRAAFEELNRNMTDLLITDIKMPGMDGLELFEQVKGLNRDIVTIFITGHGTLDTAIESLMSGVDGFVLKPFTQEELLNTVERSMNRSRLQKENIRLKALIPLFEISKLLVTEIDLAHLFKIITEVLVQEFSVERVSLMLLDEKSDNLVIRASHGLPMETALKARRKTGEGISGLVLKNRKPLIISRGGMKTRRSGGSTRQYADLSMSVLLIGGTNVRRAHCEQICRSAFTTSDLQVLDPVWSCNAMENAGLYENLRRTTSEQFSAGGRGGGPTVALDECRQICCRHRTRYGMSPTQLERSIFPPSCTCGQDRHVSASSANRTAQPGEFAIL
jgi:DNA-binding response OmpR family regulator